jgi:hypothetical protein
MYQIPIIGPDLWMFMGRVRLVNLTLGLQPRAKFGYHQMVLLMI